MGARRCVDAPPLLLGQHAALEAIQREMKPNEKLFAFLDDLYLVSKPDRVGALHNLAHAGVVDSLSDPCSRQQNSRVESRRKQARGM